MDSSQSSPDDALTTAAMPSGGPEVIEAGPEELNQWKRGFTPQAEIWNGRMAMVAGRIAAADPCQGEPDPEVSPARSAGGGPGPEPARSRSPGHHAAAPRDRPVQTLPRSAIASSLGLRLWARASSASTRPACTRACRAWLEVCMPSKALRRMISSISSSSARMM
ncbi:MAG: hypothetical protein RLZZ124_1390 [Cyanobacteriota bacterium]